MYICRNAEGVHGKRKVGNPWAKHMNMVGGPFWLEALSPGALGKLLQ